MFSQVRMLAALTVLLVLAALLTQVSLSLPKTSYFKMVDVWLLFCIITIFLISVDHFIIDAYVDYSDDLKVEVPGSLTTKDEEKNKKLMKIKDIIKNGMHGGNSVMLPLWIFISRVTIAVLIVLFNVVYWGKLCVSSGLLRQQ